MILLNIYFANTTTASTCVHIGLNEKLRKEIDFMDFSKRMFSIDYILKTAGIHT